MILTSCQKNAIQKLKLWWKDPNVQYFVLSGYAGTGKTTIVNKLIDEIKNEARSNKEFQGDMSFLNDYLDSGNGSFSVLYMAFTGKASNQLRKHGLPAKTIHSTIYKPIPNGRTVDFIKKDKYELGGVDLFVIDEASMLDEKLFNDLCSFDIPIIFIGDHGQLGNTTGDNFNIMMEPDVKMHTVTRQAEESPIIHVATLARQGKYIPNKIFGEGVAKFPANRCSVQGLANASQVIVAKNKTRHKVNNLLRTHFGYTDVFPQQGDKLVCLRNNYELGLINGGVGHATHDSVIPNESVFTGFQLHFDSDELKLNQNTFFTSVREFNPDVAREIMEVDDKFDSDKEYQRFDFGYALTAHKCLTLDTMILTNKGYFPLVHFDNNALPHEMKEYSNSDLLPKVYNGKYFESPLAFFNNGLDYTYKVTNDLGMELNATSEHHLCLYSVPKGTDPHNLSNLDITLSKYETKDVLQQLETKDFYTTIPINMVPDPQAIPAYVRELVDLLDDYDFTFQSDSNPTIRDAQLYLLQLGIPTKILKEISNTASQPRYKLIKVDDSEIIKSPSDPNHILVKISNINKSKEKSNTYCLKTPSEVFTQNGMVHGNCQGSQFDFPIVFDEAWGDDETKRRIKYTMYTRAVSKLLILDGPVEKIKKDINK